MPDITLTGPDGSFSAYLAEPEASTGPGLLFMQEIFGVNQDMRDHCDAMAARGYVALCPDLFWRQQPGVRLTDQTDAEWAQAAALYRALDVDKAVEDLVTSLAHLRALPSCNGKVGTIGFCLGGLLAFLMATRSDANCNVGYYGVGIEERLEEAGAITAPTLLHIAEEDRFVPAAAQAQITGALKDHPRVTVHSYPGMDHAFARHNGTHFDAAATALAEERTAALFTACLR